MKSIANEVYTHDHFFVSHSVASLCDTCLIASKSYKDDCSVYVGCFLGGDREFLCLPKC